MRRTFAILALSGLLAAVVGSAAALTVSGGVIQQGSDNDLTCTPAVAVGGWGLEGDTGLVSNIRFVPVAAACNGADIIVRVSHTGGPDQQVTATLPLVNDRVTLTPALSAASITGLEVFLEGGGS